MSNQSRAKAYQERFQNEVLPAWKKAKGLLKADSIRLMEPLAMRSLDPAVFTCDAWKDESHMGIITVNFMLDSPEYRLLSQQTVAAGESMKISAVYTAHGHHDSLVSKLCDAARHAVKRELNRQNDY